MGRDRHHSRALAVALAISLLLHTGIVGWLFLLKPPVSLPSPPRPVAARPAIEVELSEPPVPEKPIRRRAPRARPKEAPPPQEEKSLPLSEDAASFEENPPPDVEPPGFEEHPRKDVPAREAAVAERPSARRRIDFTPSFEALGDYRPRQEAPGGRTLRRGEEATSSPVDAAMLEERVSGWAEDFVAEGRAQPGLVHPYFVAVGEALERSLGESEEGTPTHLGVTDANAGIKHSYREASSAYGRTGNPGFAPPGAAPLQTEQLRERFGSGSLGGGEGELLALIAQAQAQARETQAALERHRPLATVRLELRQRPDGTLIDAKLLQRSGNRRFDAFVLRTVPEALADLSGPAPPDRPELRSVWEVEGWLRRRKDAKPPLWETLLPTYGIPIGALLDQVRNRPPEESDFEYRVRPLRLY